ncbi:carboxylate-amine ligase [Labedaea rhizosphaerae]|uniref:Putative glutamate--cysteine ligase 2 n=1 Tax=Labedaea rhizosphaerae TaxID=598644 RepID=A0A4R6RUD1_LABRH|nr:glutamate--cysteine ligase [Labedaea rhizosphaerae]TDP89957.1 carboxylate-amine ligase [Labedaea rhizosphaerae]
MATFGVEEEFILVDDAGLLVEEASETLSDAPTGDADLKAELWRSQVESATEVCSTAAQVETELTDLRRKLAAGAEGRGLRLVAVGTTVHPQPGAMRVAPSARYQRMTRHFGRLVYGGVTSGCHVHVGVADPEDRIQVVNQLRPWLPVLLALSANSPFHGGQDTGYASTRYLLWRRWPTAGPPPHLRSAEDYEHVVSGMIRSEAAMDRKMIYWDVRPSEHQDTVEVRVHDVPSTVAESTLLAILVRGLVHAALESPQRMEPLPHHVLEGEIWRAARDGWHTAALDPETGDRTPVPELLRGLVGRLSDDDDRAYAKDVLAWIETDGNGAERQHAEYRRRESLNDVVDILAAQTTP